MYYSTTYPSPIGLITLAGSENSIAGLWLEHQKYFLNSLPEPPVPRDDLPVLCKAKSWLNRYFSGEKPAIDELPLAPIGSQFRQDVWAILRQIPYGQVTTYGDIAKEMAQKMGRDTMSAQAVGGAVGHNPISIIIPCHRVVGTDGSLTGYAGGIDKKIQLLKLEGVDLADLHVPKKGSAI